MSDNNINESILGHMDRIAVNRAEIWFGDSDGKPCVVQLWKSSEDGKSVWVHMFSGEAGFIDRMQVNKMVSARPMREVIGTRQQQFNEWRMYFRQWRQQDDAFKRELSMLKHEREKVKRERFDQFSARMNQIDVVILPDRPKPDWADGERYIGIRSSKENRQFRSQRIAHCWHCRQYLDNYHDFECRQCGGILCGCGACTCRNRLIRPCRKCASCDAIFRYADIEWYAPFCSSKCRQYALDAYAVYLKTTQWGQRRKIRLEYDSHRCQDCPQPANEVHHDSYRNLGREQLEDLISLCKPCHDKRHRRFRESPYSLAAMVEIRE